MPAQDRDVESASEDEAAQMESEMPRTKAHDNSLDGKGGEKRSGEEEGPA